MEISRSLSPDDPEHLKALHRLCGVDGDPLVEASWSRVLFLHFSIPSASLRPHVPAGFEIEEREGRAWVSLVGITMSRFRPLPSAPALKWVFPAVGVQRFFNLRTYVRRGEEAGLFFLNGWISPPWGLPLPNRPLGLPCHFARFELRHGYEQGVVEGRVRSRGREAKYRVELPGGRWAVPAPGSRAAFLLERYSGFFSWRGRDRVFRAHHRPWRYVTGALVEFSDSLVRDCFSWFAEAEFVEAHFSTGFYDALMGRTHALD
jgi:uncharacterized protein